MLFEVTVEQIMELKRQVGNMFYVEDEEEVTMYVARDGIIFKAEYYRPDNISDSEEASTEYLLWKQAHLGEAMRVLNAKEHTVKLEVSDD